MSSNRQKKKNKQKEPVGFKKDSSQKSLLGVYISGIITLICAFFGIYQKEVRGLISKLNKIEVSQLLFGIVVVGFGILITILFLKMKKLEQKVKVFAVGQDIEEQSRLKTIFKELILTQNPRSIYLGLYFSDSDPKN